MCFLKCTFGRKTTKIRNMTRAAPPLHDIAAARLNRLGGNIREHRKALRVSAQAAAEAAGVSRVTWHRIERGEPSVTMGAYLNALNSLGLEFTVQAPPAPEPVVRATPTVVPDLIRLADYPQLKRLAWHAPGLTELTPAEALSLYERNWRHLDRERMQPPERELLGALVRAQGKGRLLV